MNILRTNCYLTPPLALRVKGEDIGERHLAWHQNQYFAQSFQLHLVVQTTKDERPPSDDCVSSFERLFCWHIRLPSPSWTLVLTSTKLNGEIHTRGLWEAEALVVRHISPFQPSTQHKARKRRRKTNLGIQVILAVDIEAEVMVEGCRHCRDDVWRKQTAWTQTHPLQSTHASWNAPMWIIIRTEMQFPKYSWNPPSARNDKSCRGCCYSCKQMSILLENIQGFICLWQQ